HSIHPKSASIKVVFMTSYLTAVIIMSSYSAAFITHLTLREIELPFRTFEEFLRDKTYHMGMVPNTAQMDYFKESKVDLLNIIYKKKIYPNRHMLPRNNNEGLEKICQEKNYAHVTSTYILIQQIRLIHCSIVLIPQAFFPGSIAITMVKESHYKGIFNK
ncbi:hypothetical protein L9F63_021382, partial [Diploptera punctata]